MNIIDILNFLYAQSLTGGAWFVVILFCYLVLEKRFSISLYSSLWFSVFLVMWVPFSFLNEIFPKKVQSLVSVMNISNELMSAPSVVTVKRSLQMSDVLVGIWLLGASVAIFIFVLKPLWELKRFFHQLVIVETDLLVKKFLNQTEAPCKTKDVLIFSNSEFKTPFVSGFLFPQIYIPQTLVAENGSEAIRGILLHEEAHARGYDNLKNLVARLILCIFWFLPFLYIAIYFLKLTQEVAADNYALVRLSKAERVGFAQALVSTALNMNNKNIFRTTFNEENHITRRLNMIKNFKTQTYMKALLPASILVAASCAAYAVTVQPQDEVMMRIEGTIRKNGQILAKPRIVTVSGELAKIVSGDKSQKKVVVVEALPTYSGNNQASVTMRVCEKDHFDSIDPKEELDRLNCEDIGAALEAKGPLNLSVHSDEDDLQFDFVVSKVKSDAEAN